MVELREPLESLIRSPRTFTAATPFPRSGEIRLYDTTLRDGEQIPGITIHPAIYQVIEPESVGGQMRFLFGKHSGAMAIEAVYAHLDRLGLTEEDLVAYARVLGHETR